MIYEIVVNSLYRHGPHPAMELCPVAALTSLDHLRHLQCLRINNISRVMTVANVGWETIPLDFKRGTMHGEAQLYVHANLTINNFKLTVVE